MSRFSPVPSSLQNPYRGCGGAWVRGNLHCHSKEHSGCASVPLSQALRKYHEVGARFLAVTDHDHVTDLEEAGRLYPGMVFLQGFEYSSTENMLFIGEKVPPLHRMSINSALENADGLLTVICHPRPWVKGEYWTVDMILGLPRLPLGIEVYNGHYSHAHVSGRAVKPLYTDIWDDLLGRGARLWGFANDDFHDPRDFGNAFNMVHAEEPSGATLLAAFKAGRFYATTGLLLDRVSEENGTIRVSLADDAEGRFVGPGGRELWLGKGREFSYKHAGEAYVRFEAMGLSGRIFLQPFFAGQEPE